MRKKLLIMIACMIPFVAGACYLAYIEEKVISAIIFIGTVCFGNFYTYRLIKKRPELKNNGV